jgi:hypothetical protein
MEKKGSQYRLVENRPSSEVEKLINYLMMHQPVEHAH